MLIVASVCGILGPFLLVGFQRLLVYFLLKICDDYVFAELERKLMSELQTLAGMESMFPHINQLSITLRA